MGIENVFVISEMPDDAPRCACCQKCEKAESSRNEDLPLLPKDDCCLCVCDGAILQDDANLSKFLSDCDADWTHPPHQTVACRGELPTTVGGFACRDVLPPPELRAAGRTLLAAVQAFLL